MKKKNNGIYMLIGGVVLVVGILFLINFLMNKQQEGYLVDENGNKEEITVSYSDIDDIEVEGVDLEGQPMLGEEEAPVTVINFGDFKCVHCATWEKGVFPSLKEKHIDTGNVKFYYVNFQFLAPDSILAGIAGEAIYNQSEEAFWEFFTKLYATQKPMNETWATKTYLKKFVKENISGIDYARFEKELDEEKYLYEVKKDITMGEFIGVRGTPAVFVNGVQVANTFAELDKEIQKQLGSE